MGWGEAVEVSRGNWVKPEGIFYQIDLGELTSLAFPK